MQDTNEKGPRGQAGRARVGSGVRARNHTVILNSEATGGVRARIGGQFGGTSPSGRVGGLEDPAVDADPHWETPPVSSEMLVKKQPPPADDEYGQNSHAEEGAFGHEAVEPLAPIAEDGVFEPQQAMDEEVPHFRQAQPFGIELEDPLGLLSDEPLGQPESLDEAAEGGFENQVEEEPLPAARFIKTAGRPVEEPEFRPDPMPRFVHVEEETMDAHAEQRHEEIAWKSVTPLVGFLVSFDHDENGSYLELRTGRLIVTCQREGSGSCLVLHDESVSPMHAVMRVAAGGSIQILDQLSESGTRIRKFSTGEEILLSGEKAELNHGDIVGFGDRTFHVCLVMSGANS